MPVAKMFICGRDPRHDHLLATTQDQRDTTKAENGLRRMAPALL